MKRIYILCLFVHPAEIPLGYYATLEGALKDLNEREKEGFGNLLCDRTAPLHNEIEARTLHYKEGGDYYGRIYIKSAELND